LYRAALALRRTLTGPLRWHESAPGVLDVARDGLRCVVNLSGESVALPEVPDSRVVRAGGPIDGDALPADTTVWIFARSIRTS
jgi:alpha-glucosidase